jgi:tripartite ATP-independent transporter DctM subunit
MFAAMVGISGAATTSMGLIALPSMLKRGYKKDIAIGCISAGGSLGILIPPSVLMIILALSSRQSVGQMFIAGILPGLLLSGLFVAYILIRCHIQKDLGPSVPPEDRLPAAERFKLLGALLLPIGLIFAVMGSMFFGIATPSEASAIGALGAIVSALLKRTFTWESFSSALFITLRLSAMVIWIVFAASAFTALYAVTGASSLVSTLIKGVGDPWMVMITMQAILFVLGMFFDPTGIVLLTAPIFFPIVISLGFDPLWFAILFVINMELAYLTPPFGFNLFYMKAVVPPDITMMDIYKTSMPFVLLMILGLAICMVFPGIITWLPSLMMK